MRISELGDCSMVIMKDSEDPPWVSVGDVYRKSLKRRRRICVDVAYSLDTECVESSDCIYTAGRLILFFKDHIPDRFHLYDKVILDI